MKDKLDRDYKYFLEDKDRFSFTRHPKIKCLYCKKIVILESFDVNCTNGKGYLNGEYAQLFRCPKCKKLLCFSIEELEEIYGELKKEIEE